MLGPQRQSTQPWDRRRPRYVFCSMKITQDVRVYAAKQNGGVMYMTAAPSWHWRP
jgi:hypothetical protein